MGGLDVGCEDKLLILGEIFECANRDDLILVLEDSQESANSLTVR